MTGFSPAVRAIVHERAGGRCERCGALILQGAQLHHRRPRGMGGSKALDTNGAANCLALCVTCHNVIEHNREMAYKLGWLVHDYQTPGQVPALIRGEWLLLDNEGMIAPCEPPFDHQESL